MRLHQITSVNLKCYRKKGLIQEAVKPLQFKTDCYTHTFAGMPVCHAAIFLVQNWIFIWLGHWFFCHIVILDFLTVLIPHHQTHLSVSHHPWGHDSHRPPSPCIYFPPGCHWGYYLKHRESIRDRWLLLWPGCTYPRSLATLTGSDSVAKWPPLVALPVPTLLCRKEGCGLLSSGTTHSVFSPELS